MFLVLIHVGYEQSLDDNQPIPVAIIRPIQEEAYSTLLSDINLEFLATIVFAEVYLYYVAITFYRGSARNERVVWAIVLSSAWHTEKLTSSQNIQTARNQIYHLPAIISL